ncbi:MAG TPA: zinc ribbon domain-containing protein [Anaerolineales bacterium]|nr:zinc ribbon domain-containing protein [Anaerolineales bacterium]
MGKIAMLTLKKLFSPEVHDICPSCGEACAITDVLCPKCGKNLDELFEQLSDSDLPTKPTWIAKIMKKSQILKVWHLTNSAILVTSLLTPWIVFFSDNVYIKFEYQYELGFELLFYPFLVLSELFQRAFYRGEFALFLGLSLLAAAAPAIAIYYSFSGIRSFFKVEKRTNPISSILRLILVTLSLVLINYSSRFNSFLSFGYVLVIIGFISSFILEFALLSYKPFQPEAA